MSTVVVNTQIEYGLPFTILYSEWPNIPAGNVKLTKQYPDGQVRTMQLPTGVVVEDTPGDGTVTCQMPPAPTSSDFIALYTGPGVTLELS